MKKSTLILILSAAIVSCTKENSIPATANATQAVAASTDNSETSNSVSFVAASTATIYLTPGMNTLQTDSFYVDGAACAVSKFTFKTDGNPNLSNFKFYINGGQVPVTVSYANNTITVAVKRKFIINPGSYSFILQARTLGTTGTTFSISLDQAEFLDANRLFINTFNLPIAGNTFIMN